ncbi:MAG: DUF6537 domain-containing protein, partial [Ilumatobacteraceae bacterium]
GVAATSGVPTGQMIAHPDTPFPSLDDLRARMDEVSRAELNRYLDAAAITDGLFGATTTANVLTLGVAVQAGAVPVDPAAIERAIELNGVAVERNRAAFRWGRRWAVDPDEIHRAARLPAPPPPETVDELIDRLAADLADSRSARHARRFRRAVDRARAAERDVDPDGIAFGESFTIAVARNLHKLMTYKDEYEVARLLLLDESRAGNEAVGGPGTRVTLHLHPPLLRRLGMQRKLRLRHTAHPTMRLLRAAKGLRNTPLDPFRWDEVRRVERAMIPEYLDAVERLRVRLAPENHVELTAIAELPDQVRGFESLKLRRATAYRAELTDRLAALG